MTSTIHINRGEQKGYDCLLRQVEVQNMLGVAASTIEQWRLRGQGPRFVKLGRSVRYRLSDVNSYLASLKSYGSTTEADHAA